MSRTGLVATGHHLASQVGVDILKQGGNAFDSAVAISATLSVILPQMTALGGDAFALLHNGKTGKVMALNASGPSPKAASSEKFLEKGLTQIPPNGFSSVSVPGLVDCWGKILKEYGSMKLRDLLKPAIAIAKGGFPIHDGLSRAIEKFKAKLAIDPVSSQVFLHNGIPLQPGEILIQKDLAHSLEIIATEGVRSFYKGSIAQKIINQSHKLDGLLAEEDLANYQSEWKKPLSVTYRDYIVFENPPVSQGHILLQELNVVEGFDLTQFTQNSANSIHLMVEAKKLAFADRLQYTTDPEFAKIPLDRMLSKEYANTRRTQIDMNKTITNVSPGKFDSKGDTTYFSVVDKAGNGISFIQSLFQGFGSGVTVKGTGILLNDRMTGFSLENSHVNRLEPGKKTTHTLNTYLIMKNGHLRMIGGSPGGDDQVQVGLQVITNILDYHMNVQEAIEAPRWSSRPGTHPGEEKLPYELWVEDRIPSDIQNGLVRKGHTVKEKYGWSFGSVKSIVVDEKNYILSGGADPRRDGYAIGL